MINKISAYILIIITFYSCTSQDTTNNKNSQAKRIILPEIQQLVDSLNVSGSVLVCDLKKNEFYSNNYDWAEKGYLPASTFKIPNSIIALETGVVENDSTLFKWDRKKRSLKSWEQDLVLRDAFHLSCVPCYQEIARSIGPDRMREYLNKLNYQGMKFDSTTIDNFWLVGDSKISQFEQIDFLRRFYFSELPISKRTEKIMKRLIVKEENEEYKLSCKTGWSDYLGVNNGWYVGYIEKGNDLYFFATNISPKEGFDMKSFGKTRIELTNKSLKILNIIN